MKFRVYLSAVLFAVCDVAATKSYDQLTAELKEVGDDPSIHRLKSQIADAAIQRLESENLSKTAQKKIRAEIRAHCADVQLGVMDLWYGDSVVTWGRLLLLDDRWKEARSVMMDQAEVLQNIEKNLTANKVPVSSIAELTKLPSPRVQ